MKVHLIKRQSIEEFCLKHARSKSSFNIWLTAIKFSDWEKPEHIRDTFSSADLLGNGSSRVIFDVGGNNYRMICRYAYGRKQVHLFVCWIGTHAEYDKLIMQNEQYTVNKY